MAIAWNDEVAAWTGAAPLVDWMVRSARGVQDVREFFSGFCARVVEAGVPIARATLQVRTLHPEFRALSLRWRAGEGSVLTPRYRGIEDDPAFTNSPIYWIFGGMERFRRHLENPEVALDFSILSELKAEGYTDYLAVRLPFTDGTNHAITWATQASGGFLPGHIAFLDTLVPFMGLVIEARTQRLILETLLKVYLGADAGTRVLRGQVTRGTGQTIAAAILFADMRGFTELSETLPASEMIAILDAYFESVIGPVEAYGGEVLKLIGDGILAIFPLHAGGARPACLAALSAAGATFANLAEVNRTRSAQGALAVRIGISLHEGPVFYGNIGTDNRLDFTVIGPAVNLVGRMQQLCRRFGKGVLLSERFAQLSGVAAVSLGRHHLRGVSEPQEVFGLTPREDPYFGTETPAK